MIKGCQKKMIFVSDVGSRYFDAAYFIIKEGFPVSEDTEKDMLAEADRLLAVCASDRRLSGKKNGRLRKCGKALFWLTLGACAAFLIARCFF